MLILDNPTAVFLRQFHRKLKIGGNPLIVLLDPLALLRRHFVEDRRMSFAHFRPDLLPQSLSLEGRRDTKILFGIVWKRLEMLHARQEMPDDLLVFAHDRHIDGPERMM